MLKSYLKIQKLTLLRNYLYGKFRVEKNGVIIAIIFAVHAWYGE